MIKKISGALLAFVISAFCFVGVGCQQANSTKTHKVTFAQEGYDNVVVEVKNGENIEQIPTPYEKLGYEVVWDKEEFTNVTEDTLVTAQFTPKVYTAKLNCLGGYLSGDTVRQYTYDEAYTLPTPVWEGHTFTGWYLWRMMRPNQEISHIYGQIPTQGTWKICNETDGVRNVTIFASWSYQIIFRQEGFDDVVLEYTITARGNTQIKEADVPTPKQEAGFRVQWEDFNLMDLNKNTIINAVKTPV